MVLYARSTTFRARPDAIATGIAKVRGEIFPALAGWHGCLGLSMLVDRTSGTAIITTAWRDEQAMQASEEQVGPFRDRFGKVFRTEPQVSVWEIAVLRRRSLTRDGAAARLTSLRFDPGAVDQGLEVFRTEVLPRIEELPGMLSTSLLLDRGTGTGALAVSYRSAEDLAASRASADALRGEISERLEHEVVDVAEFEVALAHLRAPATGEVTAG